MYCELFQLNEPPFRLTPDPQFLFASKQHARAKAYMESTIWLSDGFVVITGDIGSGKTTLIESFLSELPPDVVVAHVNQTQLSPVEFLQALLVEFGFEPFRMRKIELLTRVRDHMIQLYASGKKVLLIVDEAQNLGRSVLEEIRMLSGIEAQKEKLLRIILAGQPELSQKLDSPNLEQLTQRVRLRFHLSALSKRETREYIEHRLNVAGAGDRRIFTDDAFDVVFRYSGGVPRLTNILCDTAMLCAFTDEKTLISPDVVLAAVDELQWVEFSERVRERERSTSATGRFAGPTSASPASLELLFRGQHVAHIPLALGRTIIGRTSDNDLQIRSKFVSRHHAQITTDRRQCVIEDLNSTNGVFIGSQRIKHHVLSNGDVVHLGEHRLVYHDARGSEAEESARLPAAGGAADDARGTGRNNADADIDLDTDADAADVDLDADNHDAVRDQPLSRHDHGREPDDGMRRTEVLPDADEFDDAARNGSRARGSDEEALPEPEEHPPRERHG